jgi:3-oxoacyl-[acyl-carrier protein] reductase
MVAQTVNQFGGVQILVNNAGCLRPTPVAEISEAEWDLVMDVNLKGTFLCSQAVLGSMKQAQWGRIVNFSSTAGKNVSTIGGAHYTAAKAGILGFTRHLAMEVARQGITVNSVCPELIDTEMVRGTISPERTAAYARGFPIPRLGTPEEVADLVAFLCSERAAYITGASLDINGGDLMI